MSVMEVYIGRGYSGVGEGWWERRLGGMGS